MNQSATSSKKGGHLAAAIGPLVERARRGHQPIDVLIISAQEMLTSSPEQTDVPACFFGGLSTLYFQKYQQRRDIGALRQAVKAMEQAIDATYRNDDGSRPFCLKDMSNMHHHLYKETGDTSNLSLSITKLKEAIDIFTGSDDPCTPILIHNLNVLHEFRYKTVDGDFDQLVLWAREALSQIPDDHMSKARHLFHLSTFLGNRFLKKHSNYARQGKPIDLADLDEAVNFASISVNLAEVTPNLKLSDRHASISNLCDWMERRFEITFDGQDLEDLIYWRERQLDLHFGISQDIRADCTNKLGVYYYWKVEHKLDPTGIDQAIALFRNAAKLSTHGSAHKMMYLNNLIDCLRRRFEESGALIDQSAPGHPDLDEAVAIGYTALQEMPQHAMLLKTFAGALGRRYRAFGSPEDIEEALKLGQNELAAAIAGNEEIDDDGIASCLHNQANFFGFRFERLGDSRDIDEAVRLSTAAVELTPRQHREWASRENNLAQWLGLQYAKTTDVMYLNSAIAHSREALAAIPLKHPRRPQILNNLGLWLGWRYERSRITHENNPTTPAPQGDERRIRTVDNFEKDLEDAINALQEALDAVPEINSDYIRYLNNLGKFLTWRYRVSEDDKDIDKAIDLGLRAKARTPINHPERARHLSNLVDMYRLKYLIGKEDTDINSAIDVLKEIVSLNSSPPVHRINAVLEAVPLLEATQNFPSLSEITGAAVRLLPQARTRSLRHTDQQDILRRYAGLTSLAVASTLQAGHSHIEALQLLEEGRGIISRLQFDTRTDLSDLKATEYSQLAIDFENLCEELGTTERISTFSTESSFQQSSQMHLASRKLEEKIQEIRKINGFENFLEPPKAHEFMKAPGKDGKIVIINISFRSDAFIIDKDSIRLYPLGQGVRSELTVEIEDFAPRHKRISKTLEWLWDTIANPVLEHLNITKPCDHGNWPTICWIPTGPLSLLPLHAAGYHFDKSRRTVLDRAISSYSPSVKALLYTLKNTSSSTAPLCSKRAVLVSMPNTMGLSDLPFAETEITLLGDILDKGQISHQTVPPTREDVQKQLPGCEIFHFAGHGVTDVSNPSESGIVLKDNKLTVQNLNEMKLHQSPPLLAYLSACSTGRNGDEALQDEGIHLMGACQLAGFRHAIGSLWAVSDSRCAKVAQIVYETIIAEKLTDRSVAKGLHLAVRKLRSEQDGLSYVRDGELVSIDDEEADHINDGDASLWAAYIHVGIS
ncbi:hypothetical protein AA313_de0201519 [Arthrobotrys entomopaga]|nr:hypothetical protein AA313_de0201519 [Arthrobotrys entomopaga]